MTHQINSNTRIRLADEDDVPLILSFIKELADYENLLDKVEATEESLYQTIFKNKRAEVLFIEYRENTTTDYQTAGFALFFHNYSTFLAKPGLFLEDLFVRPAFRGKGLGTLLVSSLMDIAKHRGCGRFEWNCFEKNKIAIEFYKTINAKPIPDWTTYRIDL